jgi:hypothetical protein
MAIATWRIYPDGTLATILTIVAGAAIYGVVIFLLKGFTRAEIAFFLGLLRRGIPDVNPHDKGD